MASYSIKEDGICITCNSEVNEKHVVECYKCKVNYHGFCGNSGTFCTKTFLNLFKGLQNNTGFLFICPYCVTEDENTAASDVKQQLAEVVKALAKLKNRSRGAEKCSTNNSTKSTSNSASSREQCLE